MILILIIGILSMSNVIKDRIQSRLRQLKNKKLASTRMEFSKLCSQGRFEEALRLLPTPRKVV